MIKETITYIDYNGMERTEDFYFHFTTAEIMEMELSVDGGLIEMANRIVASQDGPSIIKMFKDLVLKAYGVKSPNGREFMKIDEHGVPYSLGFSQTEAYSKLFMKLAGDADAAARFFNGVVPKSDKKSDNKPTQAPIPMAPHGISVRE